MSSFSAHDFYIVPSSITASQIIFTFAYTTPLWSKVRFNFWASGNQEVQLGNFAARNLQVSSSQAVVSTNIQQAFGVNDKPIVRAFINGYMLSSAGVQIAISASNLQGTQLSVTVLLGSTTQVSAVWVSFIAFSPSTSSFAAYGGSLIKNQFSGSTSEDIQSNLYETPYTLFGLTQISLFGVQSMNYSCTLSKQFLLGVSASNVFDSFGIMYIIAGSAPKKLCEACGTANKAYGNTCVSSCPLGTTAKAFNDGGIGCLGTAVSAGKTTTNQTATTATPVYTTTTSSAPTQTTSAQSGQAS
jgi:hypothetical protein